MFCMYTVFSGMQEWVIQIPSIPILVSVLFPSLHLRIKIFVTSCIKVTGYRCGAWLRAKLNSKQFMFCRTSSDKDIIPL